ncbi:RING-H2 finger protein ATL46-like [Curcuma longa]|uniref:RING-H2 finger protein ATL46-like n=1 Tax=Curcuma longa TaxID=136217 RepID=UPI003D9EF635
MPVSHRSIRAPDLVSEAKNQSSHLSAFLRDSLPVASSESSPAPSSPDSRISPVLLFIIVIVALVFFIAGLLHLLLKFVIKKHPFPSSFQHSSGQPDGTEVAGSDALQRQLRQLFHLHDSGLDQAYIDALPVFFCREIIGSKEPFDCAVCLCEFAQEDKLRLLPMCGHAFHINCIDTWLLSNSTCPLCRGALFAPSLPIENPIFDFELPGEEDGFPQESEAPDTNMEKRVFSVRLGKFKNFGTRGIVDGGAIAVGTVGTEEGETSSNATRRCFSMGSYQYVVVDTNLQVSLNSVHAANGYAKGSRRLNENHTDIMKVLERNKLGLGSRGESFSESKIWQWTNNKGKLPVSLDTSSPAGYLSWIRSSRDT